MPVQLSWFPKALADEPARTFAEVTRKVGLTRCDAIIREKYPTAPGTLAKSLRPWLDVLTDHGVSCSFATTGWAPADVPAAEADLAALAEHGVRDIRLAQAVSGSKYGSVGDVHAELDRVAKDLEVVARLCEKHDLRAIYQVHHNTLLPSPSSLWPMIRDLPENRMAAMLDPGNQAIEGNENPLRSMRLLGVDRVAACGVKDLAWTRRDDGGWSNRFVQTGQGVCDWRKTVRRLEEGGFQGVYAFMPFYKVEGPDDLATRLAEEVSGFEAMLAAAGIERVE
jgi:sugar phosphate isomerase/epimerase